MADDKMADNKMADNKMADDTQNTQSRNASKNNQSNPTMLMKFLSWLASRKAKSKKGEQFVRGDLFQQTVERYHTDVFDYYVEDIPDREKESGHETASPTSDEKDKGADLAKGREEENEEDEDEDEEDEKCPICWCRIKCGTKIKLCGHVFCRECLRRSFQVSPKCPCCNQALTVVSGDMPDGMMTVERVPGFVDGYERHDTILISYSIPVGMQGNHHYHPGVEFIGTTRFAFLPKSEEGVMVCRMLWIAFKFRHTFTVGRSITLNQENRVTWNDIHHKTNISGGPSAFGYPDPTYLQRVTAELAAKGITPEFIQQFKIPF